MGDEIVKSVYLTPVLRLEVSAAVYKDRGSLYNGAEERFAKRANDRRKGKKRERDRGREGGKCAGSVQRVQAVFTRGLFIRQYLSAHSTSRRRRANPSNVFISLPSRYTFAVCVFCTPKMCSYKAPNNSGTQPRA